MLLVGLAPAANGTNRTGRMFTGDTSGDVLYAALHRTGFAARPTSVAAGDGQSLTGIRIVATVRCAPPDNQPTPAEKATCRAWLAATSSWPPPAAGDPVPRRDRLGRRPRRRHRTGWDVPRPKPRFGHGAEATLNSGGARHPARRVLPREPAQHVHRTAHPADARRRAAVAEVAVIRLARPDVRFHRSYLAAHVEFGGAHRDGDGDWVEPPDEGGYPGISWTRDGLEAPEAFARYVRWRLARARGTRRGRQGTSPPPSSGRTTTASPHLPRVGRRRRWLNRVLRDFGGHIGYSVRPSGAGRVATASLRLVLPHAASLGIDPALLTCDVENVASQRVIEADGGVLEEVRGSTRFYWVPTATPWSTRHRSPSVSG